uniref:THAP domain-containing protein 1 n=1 Tax=Maylandia zebra TaxID=106582 RepID=A0A3P9CDS3_9CICH
LPTWVTKFNGILSFHGFPTHSDLRRQWLVNIRRDHFTITSHTRLCCRHFASDQLIEPTTLDGRRRLIKGAVPTLFEWNGYKVEPPRRSVWERTERRPELVRLTRDHDYCSVPEPSALDISASAAEDLFKDVETLRKEIQELRVQREFGLQRFAVTCNNKIIHEIHSSLKDLFFFLLCFHCSFFQTQVSWHIYVKKEIVCLSSGCIVHICIHVYCLH